MRKEKYFIAKLVDTTKVFFPHRYGLSFHIEDIGFFSGPHYDDYYDIYKCLHIHFIKYEIYLGINIDIIKNLRAQ